ncbi:hypothetical protein OAC89_05550 [Deltaproteobacteria bacterium]|nr:hypothetical protein [Deltaproteobacteria bacterium]
MAEISAGWWLDLYNCQIYPEMAANLDIYRILEFGDSPIMASGVQL